MTIFFDLVKKVLIYQVTVAYEDSVGRDRSPVNTALSFFGFGRNIKLAREKREILDELKIKINELQDAESDDQTIAIFRKLIIESKTKAKEKSNEQGLDEGSFGISIDKILKRLDLIEENLRDMSLWNQKNSPDPFDVFFNHIAQYVIQKTIDNSTKNPAQVLRDNPQLSSAQKISKAKDELLFKKVNDCQKFIKWLNNAHADNKQLGKEFVLNKIQEIRRGNQTICNDNGFSLKVPIKITFVFSVTIGPDFQPSLGRLEGYMKTAEAAITGINNDEEMKEDDPEPISAAKLP